MKKSLLVLSVILTTVGCAPKDPDRAAMEQYAKAHIENPKSYKFNYMAPVREYKAIEDLKAYRQLLARKQDLPEDFRQEIEKVDQLIADYGFQTVCLQKVLHFWCEGETGLKLEKMVFAQFDTEGHVLAMSLFETDMILHPALQVLKEKGLL